MPRLPRLALGTVQPEADSQAIAWALMEVLGRHRLQVQHFRSQACFVPCDGASTITGNGSRHLDSWLMQPEVCREIFWRGAQAGDLALVDGRFGPARRISDGPGGDLDALCHWLDLPRLAVIDASLLGCCHLVDPPVAADGLLLDRVPGQSEYYRLQTIFESLWKVPVLGGLFDLPDVRAEIHNLPPGTELPRELSAALGDSLAATLDVERIVALADCREFPVVAPRVFHESPLRSPVRVAVAFDAAFNCYFPDTLDMLEMQGATVSDFSPLRGERLPPDTDVVYIGCGHPERFARELAGNHCMSLALREHVCAGRRIYAEGGGLAYLCEHIELPGSQRYAMTGVLPALARLNPAPCAPRAVEITLAGDNWLGEAGSRLRGYLNSCWDVEPAGPLAPHVAERGHEWNLVGRHHAVGSRLHLNFAAQPQFLQSFLEPHAASLDLCKAFQPGS